jgi:hypothetical protein
MPVAPENPLTVCVPDAPVNSVAAVVPERFPDAPAVQARAGWKGVIITAVLTVGGAYVAARGDKEREKPEQEIA